VTQLEEDVSLWLSSGGKSAAAEDAFRRKHGDVEGRRRARRAASAVAYLKEHHEALREAGLLALGEKPGDVRIEKHLADELARAIDDAD
jgi:hypothetical protein